MLPVRYLLIQHNATSHIVLKFEVVPINDLLYLEIAGYQFKGTITPSVVSAFNANPSNRQFFKSLPIEMIHRQQISLPESEKFNFDMKNYLSKLHPNSQLYAVQLYGLNVYINYFHIEVMIDFISQFISNYEILKVNLQLLEISETSITDGIIPEQKPNEIGVLIEEEVLISTPRDKTAIFNEILQLSPSSMTTYYISKYISNIINSKQTSLIKSNNDGTVQYIEISPLINDQLIQFSTFSFNNILNVLDSFNASNNEYISKLKILTKELIHIINTYSQNPEELKKYDLTIKIIEYLIYIYSFKLSGNTIISQKGNFKKTKDFEVSMLFLVNYSIDYILKNHFNNQELKYPNIQFRHLNSQNERVDVNLDELKRILVNEMYLLDIDKQNFISRVFQKLDSSLQPEKANFNLIFNSPNKIDINNFIDVNEYAKGWLNYSRILKKSNTLMDHDVITPEYLQILQLKSVESSNGVITVELTPLISLYAHNIINGIFVKIDETEKSHLISTLNILNIIRPFLNEDSTVETELTILYRIVIPYIFDTYKQSIFIDYFC